MGRIRILSNLCACPLNHASHENWDKKGVRTKKDKKGVRNRFLDGGGAFVARTGRGRVTLWEVDSQTGDETGRVARPVAERMGVAKRGLTVIRK